MVDKNILNFRAQAEQMLELVENRLAMHERGMAIDFLVLKFKALYEQGVISGRLYEKEGVFPFTPAFDPESRR